MHADPVPAFRGKHAAPPIPLVDVVNAPAGRFREVRFNRRGYIRSVELHSRVCAVVGLSKRGFHMEQYLPSGHVVHALRGVTGSR